jgi:hypothetical protein
LAMSTRIFFSGIRVQGYFKILGNASCRTALGAFSGN